MLKPVLVFRSLVKKPTMKSRSCRRKGAAVEVDDPYAQVTLKALEELFVFMGHVRELTQSRLSKRVGLHEWLDDLESVLRDIQRELMSGREAGTWSVSEDLEMEALDDVLGSVWSTTWQKAHVLNEEEETVELLLKLVQFWLDEIRARGYVIYGLLSGSECIDTVSGSLDHLNSINYPPVYGNE